MSAAAAKLFDTFDADKSGSVSIDEVSNGFKLFDKNNDGSISEQEWTDVYVNQFGGSQEEAVKLFQKMTQATGGELVPDSFMTIFKKMDANGDGVISKSEFETYWKGLTL